MQPERSRLLAGFETRYRRRLGLDTSREISAAALGVERSLDVDCMATERKGASAMSTMDKYIE